MEGLVIIDLTPEQKKWFDQAGINATEFIENITDREIKKWQKIQTEILEPIISKEEDMKEYMSAMNIKTGLDEFFYD
jgi:hypothetical protein